jgi:hypothetical protein
MNFEPLLESGLAPIRLLLDEVPSFLRSRQSEIGESDDGSYSTVISTTDQAYSLACQYALEAVAHLLNALVDDSLLTLANIARETDVSIADMQRSRGTLLREVEEALQTKAGLHPGWDDVERVRKEVNALKHRGGLNWSIHPTLGVIAADRIRYSEETLWERLSGVQAWLTSLARLVRDRTSRPSEPSEFLRLT